ncbi:ATPase WRNIP1-like isoform X2 [Lycorma delicatula]|uniref:ATPase WRNIP1-like isoform X2 n=1 Tax=Lycorma delicatula TaxID=130591 RepID=UPI003F51A690
MMSEINDTLTVCPVCFKRFQFPEIEAHVNKCLFFSSNSKRSCESNASSSVETRPKKLKNDLMQPPNKDANKSVIMDNSVPLAEQMRPSSLDGYIGQDHVLGQNKILRSLLEKQEVPSMILWGPPGCGKTTLAHIISKNVQSKDSGQTRFIKLSATMTGVNEVKEVIKVAKNELNLFKRKTILFMDEIHRFNKLQQDTFLSHVESGCITLIGATTENPSFSLNSALLSRCRVIVLEKLKTDDLVCILKKAALKMNLLIKKKNEENQMDNSTLVHSNVIDEDSIQWLAEMCDGDARIALNSLQLAFQSQKNDDHTFITLEDIKDGIKRSHLLYDRKGDEHYNIISAVHKSIRASDDNAALYWLTRMLEGGEDPLYIARRLVRAASEDIGLADPMAMTIAVSAMQGCQLIGKPECDVLLAQTAVYLARLW